MKSSSFEQAIQAQFDCLTKKVIKRAAMKYKRSISRRLQHEIPFSDVSDLELNKAGVIPAIIPCSMFLAWKYKYLTTS